MKLNLKDHSILFCVLVIDGETIVGADQFDEHYPMENDAFSTFIENYDMNDYYSSETHYADIEYTYYSIGSGESESADCNELDYIVEHLDEILEDATICESYDCSIEIHEIIRKNIED